MIGRRCFHLFLEPCATRTYPDPKIESYWCIKTYSSLSRVERFLGLRLLRNTPAQPACGANHQLCGGMAMNSLLGKRRSARLLITLAFTILLVAMTGCGSASSGSNGGGNQGGSAPATPTGLTATAGDTQASLTWTASSGATSYHVKRSMTSGGPYTLVSSPTATAFTDTGLTDGTKYFYVVSAANSDGESANSSEVNATPALAAPAAPTGLVATAGNAQVRLAWTASTGATTYHVKRSTTTGGPYTQIANPASNHPVYRYGSDQWNEILLRGFGRERFW